MTQHDSEASLPSLPRGRRLGVDVGDARVGLAESDLDGMIATPVETLPRDQAVGGLVRYIADVDARCVYVGLPRSLNGSEGVAAQKARDFVGEVQAMLAGGEYADLEFFFIDERLTTVTAHQALHSAGRKSKKHRSVVDQVAAVMILQNALEAEQHQARRAGIRAS